MKISFDSEELIEELKEDIKEFGDIDMYAFYEKIDGILFIVNYDFILEEGEEPEELTSKDIGDGLACIMKASKILEILIDQQDIFKERG